MVEGYQRLEHVRKRLHPSAALRAPPPLDGEDLRAFSYLFGGWYIQAMSPAAHLLPKPHKSDKADTVTLHRWHVLPCELHLSSLGLRALATRPCDPTSSRALIDAWGAPC